MSHHEINELASYIYIVMFLIAEQGHVIAVSLYNRYKVNKFTTTKTLTDQDKQCTYEELKETKKYCISQQVLVYKLTDRYRY